MIQSVDGRRRACGGEDSCRRLAAFVGPGGRFNFIKLSLLNDLLESVNLITYAYIKRLACSFIDFV